MRGRTRIILLGTALVVAGAVMSVAAEDQSVTDPELLEGEARVEAAVVDKLAKWRVRREEACRNRALAEAELRADSMILDYARAQSLQLERPARPLRPVAPNLKRPSDTLDLRPFVIDSL